jgi:signal transduction histidine kinase
MNLVEFILCAAISFFIINLLSQFDIQALKRDKIKRSLFITGIAVMGYCLTTGLDAVVADEFFYGFHSIKYAFLIMTPVSTLFFALRLDGSSLPDKRLFTYPICTVAVIDIVVFLTNPFHNLMYDYTGEAYYRAPFQWGPFFPLHAVLCYVVSIVSVILFLQFAFRRGKISVRIAAASILLPIIFNLIFSFDSGIFGGLDLTAVLYGFVFTIFSFALYKSSLLGIDVRERERYLDLVLENYPSTGFFLLTDEDFRIRIATKNIGKYGYKKIFDYKDAIGRDYYELLCENVQKDFAEYAKKQFKLASSSDDYTVIKNKYDSPLTGHSYNSLIAKFPKSEKIHGGYIVVVSDVTEINKAKIAAEAASVAKSAFLSNLSHEIRTPMNAIIGLTGLSLKEDVSEKVRLYLENIEDSGQRLLSLINDVLDISKIESGKMQISNKDFDFANMLSKSINVISEMASEKHITLDEYKNDEFAKLDRYIYSDELRISQIIVNLLSNAVKFTPEGGRIVISVDLETDKEQPAISVSVRDTGIGISPENLGKLFENFEQADNSITRQYGGTGLGLAISHRIAEMLSGSLSVKSKVGKGSEFILRIPVEFGDTIESAITPLGDIRPEFAGKHILLVEDVDINRVIAAALLEDYDCIIDIAENGKIGVDKVKENTYDLILMDMQMPVMDGITATKEMRALGVSAPIIAMTANAFREDAERCIAAGMNDHIGKPIDANVFIRVIGSYFLK